MTTSTGMGQAARASRQQSPQGEERVADIQRKPAPGGRTATVNLPFVSAEFRVPEVSLPRVSLPRVGVPHVSVPRVNVPRPSRQEVTQLAAVGVSYLPSPERLVYYAGLGALAVVGMIEWPVAVAIGAGTVVAQRAGRQHRHGPAERVGAPDEADRAGAKPAESTALTETPTTPERPSTPARASTQTPTRTSARTPRAPRSEREPVKRTAPVKRTPRKTAP